MFFLNLTLLLPNFHTLLITSYVPRHFMSVTNFLFIQIQKHGIWHDILSFFQFESHFYPVGILTFNIWNLHCMCDENILIKVLWQMMPVALELSGIHIVCVSGVSGTCLIWWYYHKVPLHYSMGRVPLCWFAQVEMCIHIAANCPLFLSNFNWILVKLSIIKFDENSEGGICRQT